MSEAGVRHPIVVAGQNPLMNPEPPPSPTPGSPRSESDAAALLRYDRREKIPIVLAAILPILISPESGGTIAVLIGVVSWIVFLVDFLVSQRRLVRYTSTWLGRFDLSVVVLTAPWFLLPGFQAGRFIVVLRLARLARVVLASKGARRLLERLGGVGLFALGVMVVSDWVAYHAEHATNPEFATFGDSLWWGIVTLTTVGYGDIVPKTTIGRWAGVAIMVTGVAVLGVLAGSLASFFRVDSSNEGGEEGPIVSDDNPSELAHARPEVGHDWLKGEVLRLQAQVNQLAERLTGEAEGP